MDKIKKVLHDERISYDKSSLSLENAATSPFVQFDQWYKEAAALKSFEANAMVLSTVNESGWPSSRVVLLKEYAQEGFVFFSNYESRKGEELRKNSKVSVLFFYEQQQRQIRITGEAKMLSDEENDAYFYSRPLKSQYGAMVSPQSQRINQKKDLEEAAAKMLSDNKKPQRPKSWGGYIIKPTSFEFWQGRPSRLHDRICYELQNKEWQKYIIAP